MPLYASGFSRWKSFWYGQLSGMVEPVAGLLGALGVSLAQSFLPYALAFAAGAMLYVVFENIIPESASQGNGKLSTWSCMIGFCIMMSLDVGLNWFRKISISINNNFITTRKFIYKKEQLLFLDWARELFLYIFFIYRYRIGEKKLKNFFNYVIVCEKKTKMK